MTAWNVKDNAGQLLPAFVCASRLEVGRKVSLPTMTPSPTRLILLSRVVLPCC